MRLALGSERNEDLILEIRCREPLIKIYCKLGLDLLIFKNYETRNEPMNSTLKEDPKLKGCFRHYRRSGGGWEINIEYLTPRGRKALRKYKQRFKRLTKTRRRFTNYLEETPLSQDVI